MAKRWEQVVVVSGLTDGQPFWLHCEPEGAMHEVQPHDVLTITFSGPIPHPLEITPVPDGLLLSRYGDSDVTIRDKRGRQLTW